MQISHTNAQNITFASATLRRMTYGSDAGYLYIYDQRLGALGIISRRFKAVLLNFFRGLETDRSSFHGFYSLIIKYTIVAVYGKSCLIFLRLTVYLVSKDYIQHISYCNPGCCASFLFYLPLHLSIIST